MIWLHEGHFTHSPSGTRLSLLAASIGLRTFLNQAIQGGYYDNSPLPTPNSQGVGVTRGTLEELGIGSWALGVVRFLARSTACLCPSIVSGAPGRPARPLPTTGRTATSRRRAAA